MDLLLEVDIYTKTPTSGQVSLFFFIALMYVLHTCTHARSHTAAWDWDTGLEYTGQCAEIKYTPESTSDSANV